eukprot:TRINITY_DN2463_c0_g1_i1.p1 TRINITY_DN2463_c0_g1~~TRINITY_DN2463_c0_g1_i1.p1  ORF type:complete len:449 (+),score=86.46 TRINITY_DN2463_c0_g1_i1:46-1392(+)
MHFSFVLLLFSLLQLSVRAEFRCQATIDEYNKNVNIGNFLGATATFTDSVKYIIPGDHRFCAYCQTYDGKDRVVSLFTEGFLGHFTIFNPLINMRSLNTNSNEDGYSELMDFNDEGFRLHPQYGGVMFRVPVIHDFLFDSNCKITQMILYQDPYICSLAMSGRTPPQVPIMPALTRSPPPSSFVVDPSSAGTINSWQYIPGEEQVSEADGWATIRAYYEALATQSITLNQVADLFIPLNYSLPQAFASVLIPGDASVMPYAGLYLGAEQIVSYHQRKFAFTWENTPLTAGAQMKRVFNNGSIAVHWTLSGHMQNKPEATFSCGAVDYFQLIWSDYQGLWKVRIARLTRFFDTMAIALAATNDQPFLPYQSITKTALDESIASLRQATDAAQSRSNDIYHAEWVIFTTCLLTLFATVVIIVRAKLLKGRDSTSNADNASSNPNMHIPLI